MRYSHGLAAIPWEDLPQGVRQKRVREGKRSVRIVSFPAGFAGEVACRRGHSGYVLEGSCSWDVGGATVKAEQGDALILPDDVPHRVFCGERDVTILFTETHD